MTIVIVEKPQSGRIDRICKICGDSYFGWNFVACKNCEQSHNYTVEYRWH